jgi:hypothetical protein
MTALTNKALLALLADATGVSQAAPDPTQQSAPLVPLPQQIAELVGTDTPEADGLPTSIGGLRALIRTMLGQQQMPTGQWPMSMNRSATRLNLLEPRVDTQAQDVAVLRAQVATLTDLLGSTRADLLPRLALAEASLLTNTANDAAEAAKQEQVRLKTVALESKQTATDTTLALVQTRLTQDEAAIAQAQATATAAKAKADADETAAAVAQAIAIAARDTANANQVALNALNARFRLKRLPIPAIGIGATGTLNVVWDTPFADDNYNAVAQVEGVALLGLAADVTARTKDGCTVQLKNGLGIGITLASATVSITATHY